MRDKLGHAQFEGKLTITRRTQALGMGMGRRRRIDMAAWLMAITDCEALLCRGMGMGAYDSMKARNIRPVVTDISDIERSRVGLCQRADRGSCDDHRLRLTVRGGSMAEIVGCARVTGAVKGQALQQLSEPLFLLNIRRHP